MALLTIFNPLWEKSKNITPEFLEFLASRLIIKDDFIVIRKRAFLKADEIGGYEAYYSKLPNDWFSGRYPEDVEERVRVYLIQKGYDVGWVNDLEVVFK